MLPMLLLARGASEQLIRDFKALLASSILSKNEGKGTVVYKDALFCSHILYCRKILTKNIQVGLVSC